MLETDNSQHTMTIIRAIQGQDIPLLSEYWYDWMALQSQTHPHIRLAPQARVVWEQSMQVQILLPSTIAYSAERDGEILGCIIGRIVDNQAGLLPLRYGFVDYLLVDLHAPKQRPALGGVLIDAFRTHLLEQQLTVMCAHSGAFSAVQQAFWRGEQAKHIGDIFWIDL